MNLDYNERPIDRFSALFFCRGVPADEQELLVAVLSLLSQSVGNGNVCLELGQIAGCSIEMPGGKRLTFPDAETLAGMLRRLPSVGRDGEHRPLVFEDAGHRLYLYRYRRYERQLAAGVDARAMLQPGTADAARLAAGLDRLFPPTSPQLAEDLQRVAAERAVARMFSIISGGPGTGKTSTVVRILCLLLEQPEGLQHRISLVAPTGKAAARLKSSIAALRGGLSCAEPVRQALPDQVTTIHRLLGVLPDGVGFRHHAANPVAVDTVIVDESSMVDLPLMAALVEALPPHARLILIGDRNQLAAVESGAVFGDLCIAAAEPAGRLSGCLTHLDRNYRFLPGSGIAELGNAINTGDATLGLGFLRDAGFGSVGWSSYAEASRPLSGTAGSMVVDAFRPFLLAATPMEALRLFDACRLLCALREGPFGVAGLNHATIEALASSSLVRPAGAFWKGRPVMITTNDPGSRLFNGDIGIVWPDAGQGGELRVFFADTDGTCRSISPDRLPAHETAFAMTVHKSQGSEFGRVVLFLPPADTPLLTRELLYTAITRARESVLIFGDEAVFRSAVSRRTFRTSGLVDLLVRQP